MRSLLRATACVLLLAGCSSTTQRDDLSVEALLADDRAAELGGRDFGAGGSDDAAERVADADGGDGPGAGSGPQSTTGGTAARSGTTDSDGGAGSNDGSGGPAPSGEPFVIGLEYLGDSEAVSANFGGGIETGDARAQGQAVADWLNARGGIAGRPIELVFHATSSADVYNDRAAMSEKACVTFTEDNKVDAAGVLYTHENLLTCLQQRGVVSAATLYPPDDDMMAEFAGSFYMPGSMNATRSVRSMAKILVERGDLPRDAKVGIAYEDTVPFRRLRDDLKQELARHGIEVVAEFGENRDDFSTVPSQNQSAVLQFRSAGVSHVLFADRGGSVALYFMISAESQSWYPNYGLASHNSMNVLALYAPDTQLVNAVGVSSWHSDSASFRRNGNATAQRCVKIMDDAGVPTGAEQSAQEQLAVNYCDWLLFFKALADQSGSSDTRGWRHFVDGGGFHHQPAISMRSRWGRGRYDAASAVRVVEWDTSVSNWRPASDVIEVE